MYMDNKLSENDIISFGPFKGNKLIDIINTEPWWVQKNLINSIEPKLQDLVDKIMSEWE